MPMPWSVEPSPLPSLEVRLTEPEEAHDASYLAASARISSFCRVSSWGICSLYVHGAAMPLKWIKLRGEPGILDVDPFLLRHAGLVPASNVPRAQRSVSYAARWTPAQGRGDG